MQACLLTSRFSVSTPAIRNVVEIVVLARERESFTGGIQHHQLCAFR
jgi:hypothetical protein